MRISKSMDFSCSKGLGLVVPYDAQINSDCTIEAPVKLGTGYFGVKFIGAFTYTNGNSMVRGAASIGRFCSIADSVTIGHFNHPVDMLSHNNIALGWVDDWNRPFHSLNALDPITNKNRYYATKSLAKKSDIIVGNDVWIGQRAIVLPGVEVGDGAIIGAGAVVTRNVPAYSIVGGNPARIIKHRFPDNIITELLRIRWWEYGPDILKSVDMSEIERAIEDLDVAISRGIPKYVPPCINFKMADNTFSIVEPS